MPAGFSFVFEPFELDTAPRRLTASGEPAPSKGGPVTMVTEWVALVGGLEQGVVLPSLSWMVGVRTRDGAEFGIGPNITPAGTALVFATGMTFRAGALNIPLNVAVVPGKVGTRVSLLTGFSLRRR